MVDLTPYNTLRIPARAQNLIEITSVDQISKEINKGTFQKPFFILGCGANVLFTRDFPGTIIVVKIPGKQIISETDPGILIELGAGENWSDFVLWAVENNWSGCENLALIPGTVGAAAVGNISAYGQNQEDIFVELKAINLTTGNNEKLNQQNMHYSYRESILKKESADKYLVTSVTYRLNKNIHLELSYQAARHASLLPELQKIANKPYSPKDVSQAVINLRTAKLPDIKTLPNAGSIFKNPIVSPDIAEKIKTQIPDLQIYPEKNPSMIKLPAGMLLDHLGWRDKKIGPVGTAPNHALIVCNYDGATGSQIFEFTESMRADIKKHFSINLEYEVVVI
jgi:UDP-N-acetylmuramate dehydrogenase